MMCQPGRSYERMVAETANYNMSLIRDGQEGDEGNAVSTVKGAAAKKPRYPYPSPEWKFWKMWLIHFMLPVAVVVWIETKSIWYALGSSLIPYILSMFQGAIGILKFRLYHGVKQPYPELPAHGVVSVNPEEKSKSISPSSFPSPLLSPSNDASSVSPTSTTSPITKEVLDLRIMDIHYHDHDATTTATSKEPPLRLLVLGDSLAIGVGQARTPTPIMPEVIAKTLSKAMGGRVVYWTCQGVPGASAGALVKIIEEGVNHTYNRGKAAEGVKKVTKGAKKESLRSATTNIKDEEYKDDSDMEYDDNHEELAGQEQQRSEEKWSNFSDTSDTSDETEFKASVLSWNSHSHVDSEQGEQQQLSTKPRVFTNEDKRRSMKMWRERLRQHKKRFDPDLLGPYDIVVVISGSNDIKAACFPYLLKGSDSVIRKEGELRGGTFADELIRLRKAISNKMNPVRESVTDHWKDSTFEENARKPSKEDKNGPSAQKKLSCNKTKQTRSDSFEPLIVLAGIPARTSPLFWLYPFRWLAIPTIDIMEGNKKRLAMSYPDEFMYVAPPTVKDAKDYEEGRGTNWENRCEEDTILSLYETKESTRRRTEEEMKLFYTRQGRIPESQVDRMKSGYRVYSSDNTHPNDDGSDFWARHIASSIVQRWTEKKNLKNKQI